MNRISTGVADETVYVDRAGGFSETKLPDGTKVQRDDPDEVYAAIQRWAIKNHKSVKVVDMQKDERMLVDRNGNIDDLDAPGDAKEAQTPLMMRHDYGAKQAAEGSEPDPRAVAEALKGHPELLRAVQQVLDSSSAGKKYVSEAMAQRMNMALRDMGVIQKEASTGSKVAAEGPDKNPGHMFETMQTGQDLNETVRRMLNEHLVPSIGEARRLAGEGWTVEELRAARKGKDMAKGKWSSEDVAKHLDALADRLEMHGMREAAEKLDVLANTIEAATLVGKPYVVEQLEKAGFGVSRYPGDAEKLSEFVRKGVGKEHQHVVSYTWSITPPGDSVFDVKGIEQEELVLNTTGAELNEQRGYFTGKSPDDFKYLVMSAHPGGDLDMSKLLISTNKEQDLISKLKKMVKPSETSK